MLLKLSGKPVNATAKVDKVKYYNLTPQIAEEIKQMYGDKIGIPYFENWDKYKSKNYCTLIWLTDIKRVKPQMVKRSNGAGWMVLDEK